jgi:hypothetical protein
MSTDYIEPLELSVKTSNLLKAHDISEAKFMTMNKEYWRSIGGLVRGWREIEEVRPVAKQLRADRRRASTIGRALVACRELNDIAAELRSERVFIFKDDKDRFRVGRYLEQQDLEEV